MAEDSGLRERKKAQTQRALLDAAQALFVERGFDATKIEDITARADVSRRTFFRYFPSKEAVVFPAQAQRLKRFRELLKRRGEESPFDAVQRACFSLAEEFMEHRQELLQQQQIIESSMLLIAYDQKLDRDWELAIVQELAAGTNATEDQCRRYRLMAGAIMGLVRAALREWFASECTIDLAALGQEGLTTLLRSFEES